MYCSFCPEFFIRYITMYVVVEYDTVLQNFNDRCPFMSSSFYHYFFRYGQIDIDCPGKKMSSSSECQFCGYERVFDRTVGR